MYFTQSASDDQYSNDKNNAHQLSPLNPSSIENDPFCSSLTPSFTFTCPGHRIANSGCCCNGTAQVCRNDWLTEWTSAGVLSASQLYSTFSFSCATASLACPHIGHCTHWRHHHHHQQQRHCCHCAHPIAAAAAVPPCQHHHEGVIQAKKKKKK